MKPMHPTKFLGCNSWTLPFPIPAGGQGPAGLQSARSRAGPAGQSSGFWPLDLQRTLGCLGKPRGSDLSAKGWSGQGLEPKGEAFLRPPGCANRGRTTWFPAPRSPSSLTCGPHPSAAPTGCRHLGTQERTQWAFPASTATPERTCPTLCDPMDCNTPGFPVLHYLLEFAQSHAHCVDDPIQPSHPVWAPSPLGLNGSQHQGFFQ